MQLKNSSKGEVYGAKRTSLWMKLIVRAVKLGRIFRESNNWPKKEWAWAAWRIDGTVDISGEKENTIRSPEGRKCIQMQKWMESTLTQVETIREREVCKKLGEISRFLSIGNTAGSCICPKSIRKWLEYFK